VALALIGVEKRSLLGVVLYGGPFLVEALVLARMLLLAVLKRDKRPAILQNMMYLVWVLATVNGFALCAFTNLF
jgi:hypothetical protein